jgi:hypothetical protein
MGRATAFEKLRVAHELRRRPVLAAAFESGAVGYSAVRAITRLDGPDPAVDEALRWHRDGTATIEITCDEVECQELLAALGPLIDRRSPTGPADGPGGPGGKSPGGDRNQDGGGPYDPWVDGSGVPGAESSGGDRNDGDGDPWVDRSGEPGGESSGGDRNEDPATTDGPATDGLRAEAEGTAEGPAVRAPLWGRWQIAHSLRGIPAIKVSNVGILSTCVGLTPTIHMLSKQCRSSASRSRPNDVVGS